MLCEIEKEREIRFGGQVPKNEPLIDVPLCII